MPGNNLAELTKIIAPLIDALETDHAVEVPSELKDTNSIDDSDDDISPPASFDPIDIRDFESTGLVASDIRMSHTVDKGSIPGSSDVWYRKEISSPAKARSEWLAQEFLRLIIPNQVETRLAYDPVSSVYYILSKEVPRFKPLPQNEKEKFTNGTYKGLGYIIVGAYFVHEADLKNGNIGLGDDNVVYKIDGDWSFASMRSNEQFPKHTGGINAAQINRLPFPYTYKAHNWLDLYIEGSLASASDIVASDIGNSAQFQQEKFETLFKLLLIPDAYFKQFVDTFIPAGAADYSDFLIERRKTLLKQASRIQGFTEYLEENKDKLEEMVHTFQEQMKSFVVQGQYTVLNPSEHQEFNNHVNAELDHVLGTLSISPSTSIPSTGTTHTNTITPNILIGPGATAFSGSGATDIVPITSTSLAATLEIESHTLSSDTVSRAFKESDLIGKPHTLGIFASTILPQRRIMEIIEDYDAPSSKYMKVL